MLVTCSNCKARLQLDESKLPPSISKARCPKCHGSVDVKSVVTGEAESTAASLPADMTPPAPHISPFERPPAAPPFKAVGNDGLTEGNGSPTTDGSHDIARILIDLLRQKESGPSKAASSRPVWDRRKALVCTDDEQRAGVASGLAAQNYEVYVAETTAEALGRMREDRMDVLVLDPNFDPVEQGFAFVMREIKLLRPAERRRLFLVYITPNARTMDLHAAFLHNANLIMNPADLDRLPEVLEVSLRHYNELYREFNRASDVSPI